MSIRKGDGTCTDDVTIPMEVSELFPEMVENRRWFHMHPEFSFSEVETAAHVVKVLP
jgi:amidohydrolase